MILGYTLSLYELFPSQWKKISPGDLGSANEHFKISKGIKETYWDPEKLSPKEIAKVVYSDKKVLHVLLWGHVHGIMTLS